MKRHFLIVTFFLWVVMPFYCWAQWNFSVIGNIQWCMEKITIDQSAIAVPSYTIRSKYVILPEAGIHVDYHLSRSFFLRSGLMVDGKGGKFTDPGNDAAPNEILYHQFYFYLDVPLFIIVTPKLFRSRRLYGGVGPFIGYGLRGWYRNEDVHTHKVISKGALRFKRKNGDGLKNFDNGINFLVGYRLDRHFSIHFIYQYGLMDIYNGPNDSYNRSMGAGIDYIIK